MQSVRLIENERLRRCLGYYFGRGDLGYYHPDGGFMKQVIALILVVGLAGCVAGPSTISTEQRLAFTCKSYDSTLEVLTAAKHRLSSEQIETINAVRPVANSICYSGGEVENPQQALERLEDILARLNGIQANVGDK